MLAKRLGQVGIEKICQRNLKFISVNKLIKHLVRSTIEVQRHEFIRTTLPHGELGSIVPNRNDTTGIVNRVRIKLPWSLEHQLDFASHFDLDTGLLDDIKEGVCPE